MIPETLVSLLPSSFIRKVMPSIAMSRLICFGTVGGRVIGRAWVAVNGAASFGVFGGPEVVLPVSDPYPVQDPGVVGVAGVLKTADLFWYPA